MVDVTAGSGNGSVAGGLSLSEIGKMLKRGDLLSVEFAGGGGSGDPLERDVGRVRDDVARGYVSLEAAKEDYGVALDRDLGIDPDATAQLRLKKTRR